MGVYFIELSDQVGLPPAQTAEEQVTWDVLFERLPQREADTQYDMAAEYFDAYGGGAAGGYNARTLNKAWQTTGTPQWVFWRTDDPDPTGASFPGPGVFGTTTNYAVETIVYVPA